MTARGAADFLTRSTAILGGLFVVLSIILAAIAGASREPAKVDTSLVNQVAPIQQQDQQRSAPAQQQRSAPTENQGAPAVPLAQ
jgi:preprotein translocase subunit SecG